MGHYFLYDADTGLAAIMRSQDGTAHTLVATASFAAGYTSAVGAYDASRNAANLFLYNTNTGASRMVRVGIPQSGTAGVVTELNGNSGSTAGWTSLVWLSAPNAHRIFYYSATSHYGVTVDFVVPASGDAHTAFQRHAVQIPAQFQGATHAWRSAYKYLAGARESAVVSIYNSANGTAGYIFVDDSTGEIFPNSTPGVSGGVGTFTRWPSTTGMPPLPGSGFISPVPLAEPGHTFARGLNSSFFAVSGGNGILQDLNVQGSSITTFNNFSPWTHLATLENGLTVFYNAPTGNLASVLLSRTAPFSNQTYSDFTDAGFELMTALPTEQLTTQIP